MPLDYVKNGVVQVVEAEQIQRSQDIHNQILTGINSLSTHFRYN